MVLENEYNGYLEALSALGLEILENRRIMLCRNFAIKSAQNIKFSSWFKLNDCNKKTRSKKTKYKKIYSRTERFEKSPSPYLTHLLNEEWKRSEIMPSSWKNWKIINTQENLEQV